MTSDATDVTERMTATDGMARGLAAQLAIRSSTPRHIGLVAPKSSALLVEPLVLRLVSALSDESERAVVIHQGPVAWLYWPHDTTADRYARGRD